MKVDPAKVRDWQNRSRKNLPRSGDQLKRTRLKPMSDQRRATSDERAEIRRRVLERDGGCVLARLLEAFPHYPPHTCAGKLQAHHIVKSSQGGEYTEANLVCLCTEANCGWVETFPIEARALGLVKQYENRSES